MNQFFSISYNTGTEKYYMWNRQEIVFSASDELVILEFLRV